MTITYYHVDSFTTELFAGNPAGVCVVPAFPDATIMQRIASENRHSQTAFVVQRSDGDFDLRWSTPVIEDDLCGHATLAAAFMLALRLHDSWPVRFHTHSGVLSVAREGDVFEMDFPSWPPEPCEPPSELLPALGLTRAQVLKSRDYLVILEDADQVRNLSPDILALAQLDIGIGGVIITAAGESDVDYVSRFFAPSVGIDEDPVTGSIHCSLAPYWGARLGKFTLRSNQLSTRGGQVRCTIVGSRIKVAGSARLYLHGALELP
jgi:PhzF family phenazine biosynthesis protein